MRRLFENAEGYVTPEGAEKNLKKLLESLPDNGLYNKNVRYVISINSKGRFNAVVSASDIMGDTGLFIRSKVCVIG